MFFDGNSLNIRGENNVRLSKKNYYKGKMDHRNNYLHRFNAEFTAGSLPGSDVSGGLTSPVATLGRLGSLRQATAGKMHSPL